VAYRESGTSPFTTARGNWVLAIDTSTERAGLALGNGPHLLERSWEAGRTQTTSVLPGIDALLQEAGIAITDLAAIAIATGPGTFTGLRVGMSIAKGLVLARELPLIGIPTLDIAAGGANDVKDLIAVLPAGRGRVVWQRYEPYADQEPRNTTVPKLVEYLTDKPEVLVIGELAPEHQQTIGHSHNHTRWENRQPGILLERARERWLRGEADDPVTLEPTYLHGVTVIAGPVRDRLRKED
jgi:tRNA threonylcarbamoyladenosine biosynthesis protein TsaB